MNEFVGLIVAATDKPKAFVIPFTLLCISFLHLLTIDLCSDQPSLTAYKFVPERKSDSRFDGNGFGPFTVERRQLRSAIVNQDLCKGKGWKGTVHISSAKASGKTTLLKLIGEDLSNRGDTVYFFDNSKLLDNVLDEIKALDQAVGKPGRVIFLVDETQESIGSPAFTFLLKSAEKITTIGSGVPAFRSASGDFCTQRMTPELFLNSADLEREGVLDFFVGHSTQRGTEVSTLLSHLCWHTGGHVYPLMRLSELLVPRILNEGGVSAEECIDFYDSLEFRKSTEFEDVCKRILPDIGTYDLKQLFFGSQNDEAWKRLERTGFCNRNGRIVSNLLVEAHYASLGSKVDVITDLHPGVKGIEQLLRIGLPRVQWRQYDAHGGAIENALTFELMVAISKLAGNTTQLFSPGLVDAGSQARKPDIFFNGIVKSYLEVVLSRSNTPKTTESLDEHVSRFYRLQEDQDPHYKLQPGRDFAILHFQDWGAEPLKPTHKWLKAFQERVFTFIMPTKVLFLGDTRIDEFPLAISSK